MKHVKTNLTDEIFEELKSAFPDKSMHEILQRCVVFTLNLLREKQGMPKLKNLDLVQKRGKHKPKPVVPERVYVEMTLDEIALELKVDRAAVIKRCNELNVTPLGGRVSGAEAKQLLT